MRGKRWVTVFLAIAFIGAIFQPLPARANITSCADTEITPHTVGPGSTTSFDIRSRNTDINNALWYEIKRPSGHYIITGAVFDESWEVSVTSDAVMIVGGSVHNNNTLSGTVTAVAANTIVSNLNWTVRVSDDDTGANAFYCGGSLGASISGDLLDEFPPEFDNIRLSSLSHNSVTVNWQTDEPATSQVAYGQTDEYGSLSNKDTSLVTSHSVTLTGLSPDTGYHYQVLSEDAHGNSGQSDDGTFLTAVAPPSNPGNQTVQSGGGSSGLLNIPTNETGKIIPIIPTEKIPPTVKLKNSVTKPVTTAPLFSGTAEDNVGIARLAYSTDDGLNWIAIANTRGIGSGKVSFEFVPEIYDDGNYPVKVRATDTSGNITLTDTLILVIDQLPPRVGNHVVTLGPQIMLPTRSGELVVGAGIDQRITLSAIGGPTSVDLTAVKIGGANKERLISLTHSATTGLWSGVLSLSEVGVYQLKAIAIDGAQNRLERTLNKIKVVPESHVTSSKNEIATAVDVATYTYNQESKSWMIWQASSYSQVNPVKLDKKGKFSLALPAGRYYLRLSGKGYRTATSQIFSVIQPTVISEEITLNRLPRLKFGRIDLVLPIVVPSSFVVNSLPALTKDEQNPLIDKDLPDFSLASTNGQIISPINLRGKPTLITFVDSWSPVLTEQLPALSELQRNPDINVVPISTLESTAKISNYLARTSQTISFLSDPKGTTVENFHLQSVPTHLFVSRRGIVKKVVSGVFSNEELLQMLKEIK